MRTGTKPLVKTTASLSSSTANVAAQRLAVAESTMGPVEALANTFHCPQAALDWVVGGAGIFSQFSQSKRAFQGVVIASRKGKSPQISEEPKSPVVSGTMMS